MASVQGKRPIWKTILLILGIVALITVILVLEVYMPLYEQLNKPTATVEPTATAEVTVTPEQTPYETPM